jgi:hypothetical protein
MIRSRSTAPLLGGLCLLSLVGLGLEASRAVPAGAGLPPAYELAPLPEDLDSLTSLAEAAARVEACREACGMVVYLWTPRMPLSRAGIPHVAAATERLGLRLSLVAHEELSAAASEASDTEELPVARLTEAMLAAGALAHAPALLVARQGALVGPAILGYKSTAAYESALARRLAEAPPRHDGAVRTGSDRSELRPPDAPTAAARVVEDYRVVGVPGAYFRWVPGRDAVAYESGQRVYLLDLQDGESRVAPGYIDFVPTPDGRYFVTPGEVEGGLTFYDADEVFDAVARGRPDEVEPIFTDLLMRDQYPSVGILQQDSTRTLYRVMTSWFEGVVYRDYDVRRDAGTGAASVRPIAEPVRPCVGVALSTPIMSPDGAEVAGRDEATGTTKVFSILEGGRCEALTDFGVPTSKVAWHRTGGSVAFSIPRRRRTASEGEQGIFVLDRELRELSRLPGSEEASRLAFPDFVGDDSVVFLIPGGAGRESVFRVVALEP